MFAEAYDWYVEHRNALSADASTHRRPVAQGTLRLVKWAMRHTHRRQPAGASAGSR
jgi:hypothetical protein